ncbi:hypothetical protein NPIL_443541 [Nephila pilipes]|uniref:Uncharacterized protein n=1 Tax=Nephila pilipes TaxID=299642 RepID=A0A8X6Q2E3_NEPPI|nr:hypothetical protein NPIL_159201 [Nephila pilipes]GFU03010.1 hypothetical protein NPIL_443541 [Nephila pilipes]
MKDELSSCLAVEFVGLKPKTYSLKSVVMKKKTEKGVSKVIIQQIRHSDCKDTLLYRRRGLAKAQKIEVTITLCKLYHIKNQPCALLIAKDTF